MLGDVVSAARQRLRGGAGLRESHYAALEQIPLEQLRSAFYVSLRVQDRPGVLAEIAGTLSRHGISISTIHQQLIEEDEDGSERRAVAKAYPISIDAAPRMWPARW